MCLKSETEAFSVQSDFFTPKVLLISAALELARVPGLEHSSPPDIFRKISGSRNDHAALDKIAIHSRRFSIPLKRKRNQRLLMGTKHIKMVKQKKVGKICLLFL